MFAIAFDLVDAPTAESHAKWVSTACTDKGAFAAGVAFDRAFKVEHGSESASIVKS